MVFNVLTKLVTRSFRFAREDVGLLEPRSSVNPNHILLSILTFRYTKPKGQLPDFADPVVLQQNKRTIEDFCLKIHKVGKLCFE